MTARSRAQIPLAAKAAEGRKDVFPSPPVETPRVHEGTEFASEAEARAYGYEPGDLEKEKRDPVGMSPAFERILSRTFAIDPIAIADDLEGQLAIPDAERVEYGDLVRRAGTASDNARKAHLLYVNAEAALAEFEARRDTTMAALRARAHESLAAAEIAGKLGKKKTITNDDVESEMARIAPDEFERVRVKGARVKLMVDQLRREAELHKHFPHTIETLLQTSRSP